eukprot:7382117-Prymnesium_polylepis.1
MDSLMNSLMDSLMDSLMNSLMDSLMDSLLSHLLDTPLRRRVLGRVPPEHHHVQCAVLDTGRRPGSCSRTIFRCHKGNAKSPPQALPDSEAPAGGEENDVTLPNPILPTTLHSDLRPHSSDASHRLLRYIHKLHATTSSASFPSTPHIISHITAQSECSPTCPTRSTGTTSSLTLVMGTSRNTEGGTRCHFMRPRLRFGAAT